MQCALHTLRLAVAPAQYDSLPEDSLDVLPQLTGLRDLMLGMSARTARRAVLQLTQVKQLTKLTYPAYIKLYAGDNAREILRTQVGRSTKPMDIACLPCPQSCFTATQSHKHWLAHLQARFVPVTLSCCGAAARCSLVTVVVCMWLARLCSRA
jgi:hypothetical protein